MGNTSKKLAAKCSFLSKHEQKHLAVVFRVASKHSEKIKEEDIIVSGTIDAVLLEKYWGPHIDPRLSQFLSRFLFGYGPHKVQSCHFERFAELYVHNVRGTTEERTQAICSCLGQEFNSTTELPYLLFKEYFEALTSTYIKILKGSTSTRLRAWMQKGFQANATYIQSLSETIIQTMGDSETPPHTIQMAQLQKWVETCPLVKHISEMVFVNLYSIEKKKEDDAPIQPVPSYLPVPLGLEAMPDYPAFIDLSHIIWLNNLLPHEHRDKWRFLFSSHIHGESFSTMAGRIEDQGATLIIIKDHSGYIFGGFAPESWILGPNFNGNDDSFLFTLVPKMRMYPATTYNNHYQYMNRDTKTLPNGLLMGGQFNFGGIWINADPFGEGSSAETCSSYRGYKRLSKEATFKIRSLEVWGVGVKPLSIKSNDERDTSVLDANPEAKAILDMAGRTRHSEGIREPPPL